MVDPQAPYARIRQAYPTRDGDEALELLARTVDAEVSPGGWDQRPMFGGIFTEPDGQLCWTTLPVPAPVLADAEAGLAFLARLVADGRIRSKLIAGLPSALYGFGVVLEAWSVATEKDNSEDIDPCSHPDREETRLVMAATVKDRFVGLCHRRGELGADVDLMSTDVPELHGGIIQSLIQMATVCRDAQRARQQ